MRLDHAVGGDPVQDRLADRRRAGRHAAPRSRRSRRGRRRSSPGRVRSSRAATRSPCCSPGARSAVRSTSSRGSPCGPRVYSATHCGLAEVEGRRRSGQTFSLRPLDGLTRVDRRRAVAEVAVADARRCPGAALPKTSARGRPLSRARGERRRTPRPSLRRTTTWPASGARRSRARPSARGTPGGRLRRGTPSRRAAWTRARTAPSAPASNRTGPAVGSGLRAARRTRRCRRRCARPRRCRRIAA